MRPSYSGNPYDEAGTFQDLHSSYGEFLRRQEHLAHFEDRVPYPPIERNGRSSDFSNRTYNGPQRPPVLDQHVGPSVKSDFWRSSDNTSHSVNQESWITSQPMQRREWPRGPLEPSQTSTRHSFPHNGIVPSQRPRPVVEQRNQSSLPKKKRNKSRRKGKRFNVANDGQNVSSTPRMTDGEMEEAAQLQIKLMAEMEAKALAKERNVDEVATNKEEATPAETSKFEPTSVNITLGSDSGSLGVREEASSHMDSSVEFEYAEGKTNNDQLNESAIVGDNDDSTKEPSSSTPRNKLRILDSKFEDVHLYHKLSRSNEPKTMMSLQSIYKPPTVAPNSKRISAREKLKRNHKPTSLMSVPIYLPISSTRSHGRQLPQEIHSTPHNGPAPVNVETDSSIVRQQHINDAAHLNKQAHHSVAVGLHQPMNGPAVVKKPLQIDDTAIDPNAYIEDLSDLDDDWSEVVSMLKPRPARTTMVPPTRPPPPMNYDNSRGVPLDPRREIDYPTMVPAPRQVSLNTDKTRSLLGAPAGEVDYPAIAPPHRQARGMYADKTRSLLGTPVREVGYPTMLPPPRQMSLSYTDQPRSLLVTPVREVDYPTPVPPPRQMPLMYSDQSRSLLGNPASKDEFHLRRQPGSHLSNQSRMFLETTYTNTEPPLFNGYQNSSSSRVAPAESYLDGLSGSREVYGSHLRGPRGMMRR